MTGLFFHLSTADAWLEKRLRGLAGRSSFEDTLWRAAAKKLMPALAVVCVLAVVRLWQIDPYVAKLWLLTIVAAVVVNETVSWGVSYAHFRLRPFVATHTTPLVGIAPFVKSFPSDHATISFTCVVALALSGLGLGWVVAATLLAIGMCVGRVVAGVHYPSDIVGGALLGIVGTWSVFFLIEIYRVFQDTSPVFLR